MENGFEET